MYKIRLFILFWLCAHVVLAQNAVKADALFQSANFTEAQKEYGLLLKRTPTSALFLYRYARCAQELGDFATAIDYFDKAGDRYDLKYFNLGEIYMQLNYPEQAIAAYKKYLQTLKQPSEREQYIYSQIRQAEKTQRYLRRVERLQVIDSVMIPLDSLLSAYPLSSESGSLSIDSLGRVVYLNQRQDYKLWSIVNDSTAWIVSSRSLMDQWTQLDTLPATINFTPQQRYPYLLNDGVTLYFAAKDTNGLGGYDIYITRYNTHTQEYTQPENIGYPYNSTANDYLLVIDEMNHIGYFATDRYAPPGYAHVYTFVSSEHKTYWRNISQDSLVAYAQLRYFLQAEAPLPIEQPVEDVSPINAHQEDMIFFVVNDSVVYTSVNDFTSTTAREQYYQWQTLQHQLEQDAKKLNQMRLQYGDADEQIRKKLTPLILELENKQSQQLIQSEQLLLTIRQTESQSSHE